MVRLTLDEEGVLDPAGSGLLAVLSGIELFLGFTLYEPLCNERQMPRRACI